MPNVNAKFIQNNCILPSDKLSWELQPQPQPQLEAELELKLELLQLLLESELHLLRAVCDPRALAVRALALIELCRQTELPIIVGMAEGSRCSPSTSAPTPPPPSPVHPPTRLVRM